MSKLAEMIVAALTEGSLLALLALIYQERRCSAPLLPGALFTQRSMRLLFTLALLAGGVMFTLLFYLPLLLQGGYGFSPEQAGMLITPLALSITLGAMVNSRLMTRLAALAVERGYGRFEWSVLDWNRPAIDFYRSLGAYRESFSSKSDVMVLDPKNEFFRYLDKSRP